MTERPAVSICNALIASTTGVNILEKVQAREKAEREKREGKKTKRQS